MSPAPGRSIAAVLLALIVVPATASGQEWSWFERGENLQPLATDDFVSDDRVQERTAREMLAMLGSINGHLDDIEPTGEPVTMWCHTCHRGRPRPHTLSESMLEVYRADGIEAAIAVFALNAEQYPNAWVWDSLAEGYMTAGQNELARIFYRKSLELDPTNANALEKLQELDP